MRLKTGLVVGALALLFSVAGLAVPASASPVEVAACTHPGWHDKTSVWGNFTDDAVNVGIRSGPNLSCPWNGVSSPGADVRVFCYYVNNEGVWYFVRYGDARGWVPTGWIVAPDPGVSC